jgi:hypothetical protein
MCEPSSSCCSGKDVRRHGYYFLMHIQVGRGYAEEAKDGNMERRVGPGFKASTGWMDYGQVGLVRHGIHMQATGAPAYGLGNWAPRCCRDRLDRSGTVEQVMLRQTCLLL